MKRFIAVLICALMLTSLLPSVAFAEEGGEPADNQQQEQTLQPDANQQQEQTQQPDANQQLDESLKLNKNLQPDASRSITDQTAETGDDKQGDGTKQTFTVTVRPNNASWGEASGGGSFEEGTSATVQANPKENYKFVKWTINGKTVSEEANYSFTVTVTCDLVAIFEPKANNEGSYKITAKPNNASWGSASGGGEVKAGESVKVTATAEEGYTFVGWTYQGEVVSPDAEYTFKVEGHRELIAVFEPAVTEEGSYKITAKPNNASWGSVSGGGEVKAGETATVIATPEEGYTFVEWTYQGANVSTNATYTFTVEGHRELVAVFEEETTPAPAKVKTTTDIIASCNKVTRGSSVMFKVSVKDANGKNVTDGYVQLYVNGEAVGTAVKAGQGITWKLTAAEKTKFKLGDNVIKAVYGGTDELAPSQDDVAVKMVKPSKHYKPCCGIDHHSGKCVNVCPGEDVTFRVEMSRGETCQWYVDKGDGCGYVRIKGAHCPFYTVKDAASKMDGYRYRCVIRNACGIVATPTFTLNIACGTLTTPKTGDMSLLSPVAAMGAAVVCLLKGRKDEE